MAELDAIAAQGGVKGMAAKAQLEQLKSEDLLEQNRREVLSAANKRKAQKVQFPFPLRGEKTHHTMCARNSRKASLASGLKTRGRRKKHLELNIKGWMRRKGARRRRKLAPRRNLANA